GVHGDNAPFGLEGGILQADILEVHLGEALKISPDPRACDPYVLHIDVLKGRGLFVDRDQGPVPGLIGLTLVLFQHRGIAAVEKVEIDGVRRDVYHVDLGDENILHDPAPSACTLEAQPHIGPDEGTMGHMYVPYPARHLTAHCKASMAVIDRIVLDNHVLRRHTTLSAVPVLPRLDTDGIIPYIE